MGSEGDMTPSQTSAILRSVAARIDASRHPNKARVVSALSAILAAVDTRDGGVPGDMTSKPQETAEQIIARAERAAEDAGKWHQGSGVHADSCLSLAEAHVEMAEKGQADENLAAAALWADAAEAEAAYLEAVGGQWPSQRTWGKSPSGQATKAAKSASKALGVDPSDFDV